jgi:hypothetical protein
MGIVAGCNEIGRQEAPKEAAAIEKGAAEFKLPAAKLTAMRR